MPISFVGATTAVSTSIPSSTTLSTPAGVQAGDLLLAEIVLLNDQSVNTPSGWTLLHRGNFPSPNGEVAWFWRVATESEPSSHQFTFTGGSSYAAALSAWRGVDTSAAPPYAVSSEIVGSGTLTHPAMTTTRDGCWILWAVGAAVSLGADWSPPSGTTLRFHRRTSSYALAGGATSEQASAGNTGTATSTLPNVGSSTRAYAYTIALQPPDTPKIRPAPVPFTLTVGSPHVARPVLGNAAPTLGLVAATPHLARPALVDSAPALALSVPVPAVARPALVDGAPALLLAVPPPALTTEIIVRPQPVVLALVVPAPHVARPILAEAVQAPDLTVGIPHLARPILAGSAPALAFSVPSPAVIAPVVIRVDPSGLVLALTVATPRLEEYGVGYGFGEVTLSLSPRWEGVGEGFGEVVILGTVTLGRAEGVGIGDGVWVTHQPAEGYVLTSEVRLEVGDLVWLVAPLAGLQGRTGLCRVLAVDHDPDTGQRRYQVQLIPLPTVEDMPAANELGRPRVAIDRSTNLVRQLREARRED